MTETFERTAIVTGASKGIGAAIAKRLASDGLPVVVSHSRDEQPALDVVAAIKSAGGRAIVVKADIGTPSGAAALFDAAEQVFSGLDVLVNNAGIIAL